MQPIIDLGNLLGSFGLSLQFTVIILLAGLLGWLSRSAFTGGVISSAAVCAIFVELIFRNSWGTVAFFIFLVIWAMIFLIAWRESRRSSSGEADAEDGEESRLVVQIAEVEPRYFLLTPLPGKEMAGSERAMKLIACRTTELYARLWLVLNEKDPKDEAQLKRIIILLHRWSARAGYSFSTPHPDRKTDVTYLLEVLPAVHDRLVTENL